jgi:hypothetical protein
MGTYKSRGIKRGILKMEEDLPEVENYIPKTKYPMPENWKLNVLRGKREDELKMMQCTSLENAAKEKPRNSLPVRQKRANFGLLSIVRRST